MLNRKRIILIILGVIVLIALILHKAIHSSKSRRRTIKRIYTPCTRNIRCRLKKNNSKHYILRKEKTIN